MSLHFKKVFIYAVLFLLPAVFLSAETKTIKVGVFDNRPKISIDEAGNVSGFHTEIIESIAKKENWNIVYVAGTWPESLKRLEKTELNKKQRDYADKIGLSARNLPGKKSLFFH